MDELGPLNGEWRRLDDDLTVLCWRTERLIALGYVLPEAAYLAISDVDVHEFERLIGKGCPTETAVSPVAASAAVPIPEAIRVLLDGPNFVHLSTLRKDGSPRNWIVWVGLEGDQVLVCTSDLQAKAADMRRDPRVGLSVADSANPYRMAVLQGRVVEMRPDHDCVDMDPIAIKYTSAPFPSRGPHRVCFVIAVESAWQRTLGFAHRPS